jgi:hypothetical protein
LFKNYLLPFTGRGEKKKREMRQKRKPKEKNPPINYPIQTK